MEKNRLTKKINLLKGLENACIVGVITGAGLIFTGSLIKKDKLSATGAGVLVVSEIGVVYTTNKRKELQIQEYWDKKRQESEEDYKKQTEKAKDKAHQDVADYANIVKKILHNPNKSQDYRKYMD
jgi:hypothetical protein